MTNSRGTKLEAMLLTIPRQVKKGKLLSFIIDEERHHATSKT